MSGGKAIEHLAKQGNRFHFDISPPMDRVKNCDFSFSGLQHVIERIIVQKEKKEGIFPISEVGQMNIPGLCLKVSPFRQVSRRGRSCPQLQTLLLQCSTRQRATLQRERTVLFCFASRESCYLKVMQY